MGILREIKAKTVSDEAQARWDTGFCVFVATLNMPSTRPDLSGEVKDWTEIVQAVIEIGWVLSSTSGTTDKKGRPQLMVVWERA